MLNRRNRQREKFDRARPAGKGDGYRSLFRPVEAVKRGYKLQELKEPPYPPIRIPRTPERVEDLISQ